ncbi:MAG: hypothetical protein OJF49_004155 [Ktedonobacterales bacterium]|jgi:hypothetical protein|nr:MAG: hypothetical protein OJF49_004155 [Ktedonobacterales bacterium]
MKVVLLRVGVDTASGGILGPVFSDDTFEFIPIPDGWHLDARTYGNTLGRHGRVFADYFAVGQRARISQESMHVDPEFETFTYGDPTRPKARLRELSGGDLLVFYAGLQGYDCARKPALYIVGYFEVAIAGLATQLGDVTVTALFSANFHVRHPKVFPDQRDRLVLVKGTPASRLLEHAVQISEDGKDRSGRRIHVLSREMRAVFGDFDGHVCIQRSPPRWVAPAYVDRAATCVRSFS